MNENTHEARLAAFQESYGNEEDPGMTLADMVISLGNTLEMIVGASIAAEAMAPVARSLGHHAGDWRETITTWSNNAFSDWELGHLMHDMAAYAKFGIDIAAEAEDSEAEIAARIEVRITAAETFLDSVSLDHLIGKDRKQDFETIVLMARTRWQLDHGKPVTPEGLARLGAVSDSRMRGLARQAADATIQMDANRLIPAQAALDWLENQPKFKSSLWKTDRPAADPEAAEPEISDPVFIPEARDGSRFLPGLDTGQGYAIGQKGHEQVVADFDEALSILSRMEPPRWRRPSPASGIPSLVTGVRWVRLGRNSLDI